MRCAISARRIASVQVIAEGEASCRPNLHRQPAAAQNRARHRRPDGSGCARDAEGARDGAGQRLNVIFLTEPALALP
jgi:hypothetical protein